MGKLQVAVAFGHTRSPLGFLLPVRNQNAVLVIQKCHNVLVGPIGIGDVGLHVGPPSVRQAFDENPFLCLRAYKSMLELLVGFPFLQEGFPCQTFSIPVGCSNQ